MPKHYIDAQHLQGSMAEFKFGAEASKRGWVVSTPLNDVAPYDFILDNGHSLFKIQVKSTSRPQSGKSYRLYTSSSGRKGETRREYEEGVFDVYALYIIPEDTWYIVPKAYVNGKTSISICTGKKDNEFEKFKELWSILG